MTTAIYSPKAKCRPKDLKALLLPYQHRWIMDRSRIKLVEKSRQIGFSWATAWDLVRETAMVGARYDSWVSSRDEIQARLFLEDCKGFAKIMQVAAKDLGEQVYQDDKGKYYTAHELQLANGRKINSMSSNADAQAGKRGSRCLDEFALHPDPRKLYAIAYPGITWGGQMSIISTHRGSQNFFNRLVEDAKGANKRGISLHTVTLQDALDQGFLYKLQTKLAEGGGEDERLEMDEAEYFDYIKGGCADIETFNQEYMCQPADDQTAFITYDLIDGCLYMPGTDWQTDLTTCEGDLYIGVDVGRYHDRTTMHVLEKVGAMFYTRRVIVLQNMPFSEQEQRLYPLIAHSKVRRCCIDATGMGIQFAERARERFGYKVEALTMTAGVKEKIAFMGRSIMEDRNLRIPDDRDLIADLRMIKKETTSAGNIRFAADRSAALGHADRFWALMMALFASDTPPYVFIPARELNRNPHSRAEARRSRTVV